MPPGGRQSARPARLRGARAPPPHPPLPSTLAPGAPVQRLPPPSRRLPGRWLHPRTAHGSCLSHFCHLQGGQEVCVTVAAEWSARPCLGLADRRRTRCSCRPHLGALLTRTSARCAACDSSSPRSAPPPPARPRQRLRCRPHGGRRRRCCSGRLCPRRACGLPRWTQRAYRRPPRLRPRAEPRLGACVPGRVAAPAGGAPAAPASRPAPRRPRRALRGLPGRPGLPGAASLHGAAAAALRGRPGRHRLPPAAAALRRRGRAAGAGRGRPGRRAGPPQQRACTRWLCSSCAVTVAKCRLSGQAGADLSPCSLCCERAHRWSAAPSATRRRWLWMKASRVCTRAGHSDVRVQALARAWTGGPGAL
jgi:hypothetical protein